MTGAGVKASALRRDRTESSACAPAATARCRNGDTRHEP
ncbi:uncharacterized protein BCN122_II2516 [Burkholderia cenocepacia]|nr:uncharacterized protein BCN122_II2516 [Burkholderia cenocepacia]